MSPNWLYLIILIPLIIGFLYAIERKRKGTIKFSQPSENQNKIGSTWILRVREFSLLIYGLIGVLLIMALAKPINWNEFDDYHREYKNGIDIVITLDVSGSMMTEDFKPNRLEASKKVAKEFIDGRKGDRIGLVVYASEAFTACPPTLDYKILKEQLDDIQGNIAGGGTAIGIGLGTAVTRLRSDSIQSKVIILLTDGVDGGADITPIQAAQLAATKNIRVYTIGVGSDKPAKTVQNTPIGPIYVNAESEIDEETLKEIAAITNGKYFRAQDEDGLRNIYAEIEKLEKRKMIDQEFKSEPPAMPMAFLNWSLVLLLITWVSNQILFKNNG